MFSELLDSEARQVFDLPPVRLLVTEHLTEHRSCRCGTITCGAFSVEVKEPAQCGSRARALATYISAFSRFSLSLTATSWVIWPTTEPASKRARVMR